MKTVRTWCIRILMILFTVIFLYPLFWNLMSAFKTNAEYLTDPYALPAALNLDNFVAAWQKANIAAYFGNSIFVTVLSTVLLLLLVIPISYVLARYRFVDKADPSFYGLYPSAKMDQQATNVVTYILDGCCSNSFFTCSISVSWEAIRFTSWWINSFSFLCS